jgi:hypothetical protein
MRARPSRNSDTVTAAAVATAIMRLAKPEMNTVHTTASRAAVEVPSPTNPGSTQGVNRKTGPKTSMPSQKLLLLDAGMQYRIDLVLKDVNSGKIGVERRGIVPPRFEGRTLESSSLVLADVIFLPETPSRVRCSSWEMSRRVPT